MGDVGDAAEDVDERLWGDDQEDENQKGKVGTCAYPLLSSSCVVGHEVFRKLLI